MSELVVTAMCDVCGALRDYTGKLRRSHLKCQPCGKRTHHVVVGQDAAWEDERHARERSLYAPKLAELEYLTGLLRCVGVTIHEAPADRDYAFRLARSWDSADGVLERRVYVNARLKLEGRIRALREAFWDCTNQVTGSDRAEGKVGRWWIKDDTAPRYETDMYPLGMPAAPADWIST